MAHQVNMTKPGESNHCGELVKPAVKRIEDGRAGEHCVSSPCKSGRVEDAKKTLIISCTIPEKVSA